MDIQINYEKAMANRGNLSRMKALMQRAKNGEKLTLGFLGGSITQGSLASRPELCYAYRVYRWWKETFPNADFTYVNAGIGATDSQFGCARAESDLLFANPDFVVVEYSVNDEDTPHFLETYEGLIRKIYKSETAPAILLVHNVCYDTGNNAQAQHGKVAKYYELPSVSIKDTIYPLLADGRLENRTITPDDLHPNDLGHELVAGVITHVLEEILDEADLPEQEAPKLPAPLSMNAYEDSVRFRNADGAEALQGFVKDCAVQEVITDIFKNGWTATKVGDSIAFTVTGSCIGVQYRKTMQLPAPVAEVVIDGDEAHAILLDANFDETWGDKLVLDTLLEHGPCKEHRVVITIKEAHEEDVLPFYLVSVIASGTKSVCTEEAPLVMKPVITHNIWGGTRLRTDYGYDAEGDDLGECWGISAHPNGEGTIDGGIFDGRRLSDLWKERPDLFGNEKGLLGDRFPLLIKIIDAKDDLSIQVHPDDAYAYEKESGSFGKTECWYVLDCPEDASLVVGHNAGSREELADMIHEGRWSELIREVPVKKGDFIQINPGTVHAIKGGLLILETQQNSDITYRVYDYDRLQNGKPRQLHVEQSIDVITVPAADVTDSVKAYAGILANTWTEMYTCKYYTVGIVSVQGDFSMEKKETFLDVSVVEGEGSVNGVAVKKGTHLILPAAAKTLTAAGDMTIICSTP